MSMYSGRFFEHFQRQVSKQGRADPGNFLVCTYGRQNGDGGKVVTPGNAGLGGPLYNIYTQKCSISRALARIGEPNSVETGKPSTNTLYRSQSRNEVGGSAARDSGDIGTKGAPARFRSSRRIVRGCQCELEIYMAWVASRTRNARSLPQVQRTSRAGATTKISQCERKL